MQNYQTDGQGTKKYSTFVSMALCKAEVTPVR